MEAVIVSSLIGLGLYLNKDNVYTKKRNYKNVIGKLRNINLPNDTYNKNIYDSNFVNYANKVEQQKVIQNFKKAEQPIKTNRIPPFFNEKIFNKNNLSKRYNTNTSIYSKNLNKLDKSDKSDKSLKSNLTGTVIENFTHNNMVPFLVLCKTKY